MGYWKYSGLESGLCFLAAKAKPREGATGPRSGEVTGPAGAGEGRLAKGRQRRLTHTHTHTHTQRERDITIFLKCMHLPTLGVWVGSWGVINALEKRIKSHKDLQRLKDRRKTR